MFELIDNWRQGLKFTSVQLNLAALVCDGLFILVAVWNESLPMNPIIYAVLRLLLTVLSTVARFIKQRSLSTESEA
uniref:DUF7940 domain-containing protein n=1 Tax=Klebsiella sp. TaxID=576 RepID=UPI0031D41AFF